MKLRKFLVESILGHLLGGNYKFKIMVWTIQKMFEKDFVRKRKLRKKKKCSGETQRLYTCIYEREFYMAR